MWLQCVGENRWPAGRGYFLFIQLWKQIPRLFFSPPHMPSWFSNQIENCAPLKTVLSSAAKPTTDGNSKQAPLKDPPQPEKKLWVLQKNKDEEKAMWEVSKEKQLGISKVSLSKVWSQFKEKGIFETPRRGEGDRRWSVVTIGCLSLVKSSFFPTLL